MQLGHLLTHGHAIGMIQRHADPQLIADFANEEQQEKSPLPRRKPDPRTKEYWTLVKSLGDMHGHAFKYAYSFLDMKRAHHISPADLEAYGRIVWPAGRVAIATF